MNIDNFFGLNGKVAMVTGASAGIGLAIVELMNELGKVRISRSFLPKLTR